MDSNHAPRESVAGRKARLQALATWCSPASIPSGCPVVAGPASRSQGLCLNRRESLGNRGMF